jgi:deoxycytidine triphosphate deaminase
MIIGITGMLGAGKGAIVEYLLTRGFKHYSVRAFLTEEILRRGIGVNRDNMVLVANDLRAKFGAGCIVEELYKRAVVAGGDAVIESIRSVGEVEALKSKEGSVLFGVDADIETRYSRVVGRGTSTDNVSFEKFVFDEQRESTLSDPMKGNLRSCIELADYNFKNDWTIADLHKKVEKVLDEISGKKKNVSRGFSAGILSDGQIKRRVKGGEIEIIPYDEKCVQPASYDLHLDNQFKIFRPHRTEIIDTKNPVKDLMEDVDLGDRDSFVLHPGSFALGLIKEVTGVDNKHVGRLEGKSSLARLGLIIHTTAGFLDPGNSLQLTLELFNASPLPIKLYPGMKIAQIAFEELQEECEVPYGKERGSSYYGVRHIQESQMHKNFEKFDSKTGLYNPEK